MLSISSVRNFMEKSGCAMVVSIVIGLVFIAGIALTGCPGARGGATPPPSEVAENAVATVGGEAVIEPLVEEMAQQQLGMFTQQMTSIPPFLEANAYGYAVDEQIRGTALFVVAKNRKIDLSPDRVIDIMAPEVDKQLLEERSKMIQDKTLKEGASEAEWTEAFKKKFGGQTPAQAKDNQLKSFRQQLEDKVRGMTFRRYAANIAVLKSFESEIKVTDEDLKKSFDSYNTKRIFLDQSKRPGEDLQKLADKIVAEVKAGKSFETAMNEYTDESPGEGKPKSENSFIVGGTTISLDEQFAPLVGMKVGEIKIAAMTGGVSIFKLNAIVPELPADFEKNKEKLRKEHAERLAIKAMQDELMKIKDSDQVVWKSEGYKVVADWYKGQSDPKQVGSKAMRTAFMKDIMERAKKAIAAGQIGEKQAILTRYVAFSDLWGQSTDAEKKTMRPERLEVLGQVADSSGSFAVLIELVDMLIEDKKGEEAAERLSQASSTMQGDFGPSGQNNFGDVASRLEKLKAGKLAGDEALKRIQEGLNQWRTEKIESEKAAAEAKKQEEAEKKKIEEEEKKAKAEANKKPAAPPKK